MAVTGTTWTNKAATTSTAELRALGGQVSAAVTSAGLVRTTDTGQVDWTTITWATGAQSWGYEVFRFNDALQSTKPVFIRLTYTQPAAPSTLFAFTATVGTATDGAGTITSAPSTGVSITVARDVCRPGTSFSFGTLSKPCYAYGDGSSLVLAMWPEYAFGSSSAGNGGLLWVERARHTDGTVLDEGVACQFIAGNSGSSYTYTLLYHTRNAQPGELASIVYMAQPQVAPTSGVVGVNMYTVPWFTGWSPRLGAPSKVMVGYWRGDMTAGNTFNLTHYGESATFVAVPLASAYSQFGLFGLAFRNA